MNQHFFLCIIMDIEKIFVKKTVNVIRIKRENDKELMFCIKKGFTQRQYILKVVSVEKPFDFIMFWCFLKTEEKTQEVMKEMMKEHHYSQLRNRWQDEKQKCFKRLSLLHNKSSKNLPNGIFSANNWACNPCANICMIAA